MSDPKQVQDLIQSGYDSMSRSSFQEASDYYNRALELLKSLIPENGESYYTLRSQILNGISTIERIIGDNEKFKTLADENLECAKLSGNKSQIGAALRNISFYHSAKSDYPKALDCLEQSLKLFEEMGDRSKTATVLGEIGVIYSFLSLYDKSLSYLQNALKIKEEINDQIGIATNIGNIGNIYKELRDYRKAKECYTRSLEIYSSNHYMIGAAAMKGNLGNLCNLMEDYSGAIKFYEEALRISEEFNHSKIIAGLIGQIGLNHHELGNEQEAKRFLEWGEIYNRERGFLLELISSLTSLGNWYSNQTPPDFKTAELKLKEALEIASSLKLIKEEARIHQAMAEICSEQERWKEAYEHYRQYHQINTDIYSLEVKKQTVRYAMEREIIEREKEEAIKLAAIEARQLATESLLYKVMPGQIARRILDGDDKIADYYPSTSILFADIQGFTASTAELPPYMLLELLHGIFSRFDAVVKKYGCTKIKTIGDGYMVVSGAPEACEDHAERLVNAAFEMLKPIEIPAGIEAFLSDNVNLQIRIGMHVGPVIAGVVGQDVFGYDIYSDAVNIASRMESTGEAGRVHVSAEFMRHLLSRFAMTHNATHGITFEKRGEIEVKGKGLMKTFFLQKNS